MMAARMRERDDEDLALEQLGYTAAYSDEPAPAVQRREYAALDHWSPSIRARLQERDDQLQALHEQLQDVAIQDAKAITRLHETIAAVKREQERDRKPDGWRDRTAHRTRQHLREQQLADLLNQQNLLLDHTPDPNAVRERADQLREQQRMLGAERRGLRLQAIDEELAAHPLWLEDTLGAEPPEGHLRARWQKTAREIAGHRIDHHVTDPRVAVSPQAREHALQRAITDTRAALGLDAHNQEHDVGFEH